MELRTPQELQPGLEPLWRWCREHSWTGPLAVLALYVTVSFAFWGLPILGHWTTRYIGFGTDPTNAFIWDLAWWPHAILHHLDPLRITDQWVPATFNAAWTTTIPLPGVLFGPLTVVAGPVASYNTLMLIGPALTAFATFLLIRELIGQRSVLLAVWAGYMVGFSTYELAETMGRPHLTMAAIVPFALWVGVRAYRRDGGRALRFPLVTAGLVVAQFLVSIEVLATATGLAVLAFVLLPATHAEHLDRLVKFSYRVALGYAIAAVALSPVLVSMIGTSPFPAASVSILSNNLLNLVVPTTVSLLGRWFVAVAAPFLWDTADASGYVGVPFLALTVIAIVSLRREPNVRLLTYLSVAALVLSLGPVAHVGTAISTPLPWAGLYQLPMIRDAAPVRLMFYVVLLFSILSSLLIQGLRSRRAQVAAGAAMVLAVIALAPNFGQRIWWSHLVTPPIITSGGIQHYIAPGETVMVFPYSYGGPSTYLEAASHFEFRVADGYLIQFIPPPWSTFPLVRVLIGGTIPTSSGAVRQMRGMLRTGGVGEVVSTLPVPHGLPTFLARTGLFYQGETGGLAFWKVPAHILSATR